MSQQQNDDQNENLIIQRFHYEFHNQITNPKSIKQLEEIYDKLEKDYSSIKSRIKTQHQELENAKVYLDRLYITWKNIYITEKEAIIDFEKSENPQQLYEVKVGYLGKKGKLKESLKNVGQLYVEDRPNVGQRANTVAEVLEDKYQSILSNLKIIETESELERDRTDITLPGTWNRKGAIHPLTQIQNEMEDLFYSMGFDIAEGPEIETDYYNFEMLNFPPNHPARDMQDTFFTKSGNVLRTHTSPVQIRFMKKHEPPIRMIAPGKVYRCDSDITHSPIFHQIEGLVIGKNISFCDLKGTLEVLIRRFFSGETKARFRPSFFPFTEPSAEVDISYTHKSGESGWLEVLGCGMVHPNVLRNGGIDPDVYTGFAFGLGIERFAMIKFGIRDIRLFYENDIRFLQQFR